MTNMKTQPITRLPWTKVLLSTLVAGSIAILPVSLRATLPITTTASNNVSVVYATNGTGSVTVPAQSGAAGTLSITSTSATSVLSWLNFWDSTTTTVGNPGYTAGGLSTPADTISFTLPGSTSAILNMITGTASVGGALNPTLINGNISSNGKVFFINPNGVTIGATGVINVAGFYASTAQENAGYFENNGTTQVFSSANPNTPVNGVVLVTNGATITSTGDVRLAGNTVTVQGGTITGNLYLNAQPGAQPGGVAPLVDIANTAAVTVTGSLTATAAGEIRVTDGFNTTVSSGNVSITTASGGNIDQNGNPGVFTANTVGSTQVLSTGGTAAANGLVNLNVGGADLVNAQVTAKGATIIDPTANTLGLGTSAIGASGLSLTSTGGSIGNVAGGTTTIATGGSAALTANTANANITFAGSGVISFGTVNSTGYGGTVTLSSTGNVSLTSAVRDTNVKITSGGILATGGNTVDAAVGGAGSVTLTSTGNMTIGAAIGGNAAPATLTINSGGLLTDTAGITATTASLTGTGNTALAAISATTLNITTPATLTQTGVFAATGTTTLNAGTATGLSQANNLPTLVILGGAGGVTITDSAPAAVTLANGTNAAGNVSLTAGAGNSINLGAAATDTLNFGGTLTLATSGAAGAIATNANNLSITGAVSLTTTAGGTIALGTAAGVTGGTSSYGALSASTGGGNLTVFESSASNLATVNTGAGALSVTSGASILTSNTVTVGGATTLTAPGTIAFGTSAKPAFATGAIQVNNASGVTVYNSLSTTLNANANAIPTAVVNSTVAANTITIGSVGAAGFGTVGFSLPASATGAVSISSPSSLTLANIAVPATANSSVTVNNNGAAANNVTLGAGIVDLAINPAVFSITSGGLGTIADTANSPVVIYGAVAFNGKNVLVNNNTANSLGGLTFTATGNIAYQESGTVNLSGGVNMTGSSGSASFTALGGSVLENGGVLNIPTTVAGLSFSASSGLVTLGSANTIGSVASPVPISISALGNSTALSTEIVNGASILLGNTTVTNGTFTASTIGVVGGTITQATGTSILVYGNPSLQTQAGAVTLTNAGNNFGTITVSSVNGGAGANVAIRESGTSNYAGILTGTGNLSITSDTANVSEASGNPTVTVGGTTTLSAAKGAVTFTSTNNTFGGTSNPITLTALGNSSITDKAGSTLIGDGSNLAGNLTVTNSAAVGTIKDAGTASGINVGGTADFVLTGAGAGYVYLTDANDTFGALQLNTTGTGTSTILVNGNTVLGAGSIVGGPLIVTAYGTITNSASGGSIFQSTLTLNALTGITLVHPLLVDGVLTVNSIGVENLGGLSLFSDLNNQTVVFNAAGTYTKPAP